MNEPDSVHELQEDLQQKNVTLMFVLMLFCGSAISIWVKYKERELVCHQLKTGDNAEFFDSFPYRAVTSSMALGIGGYFLYREWHTWHELKNNDDPVLRRSGWVNLLAGGLGLMATLLRFVDLNVLERYDPQAIEEFDLPELE